jgi:hypothetical protein
VQLERHIEAIYLSGSQIVCDEDDKRAEVPRGSLSYAADEVLLVGCRGNYYSVYVCNTS